MSEPVLRLSALGFAYDGLSAIEDVKSRLSKRRVFKGRKPKKKSVGGDLEVEESEPDEEPVAEPRPPMRPFDQSGNVGDHKWFGLAHLNHPQIGLKRRKGIIGNFRSGGRYGTDQG